MLNEYMDRAVQLAAANVQDGGRPFGAVLVKNGNIVAEGVNELHKIHDVSGHAEMLVIRQIQKEYETDDLSSFALYASGHPCPMCLTAMYFAGIKEAYYCQSLEDAKEAGLSGKLNLYEEIGKDNNDRYLKMSRIPLDTTQINPMKLWQEQEAAKDPS